ncbi:MAG: CopD family protein [Rhodospirillales bacterium]|nr:CopD family protein [Rhodospirillales bacterium]
MSTIAHLLHAVFAVIWVGGMVFAYAVLRPAASGLEPPSRLVLWNNVFRRFFIWVWHSVVLLPLTGYVILFDAFGGFAGSGLHIHLMQGTGWLMIAIYIGLYFRPYKRFKHAVSAEDWPLAGQFLGSIRRIVAVNTVLGLVTVAIGASGRYWG